LNPKIKWDPYNFVKYIADKLVLKGANNARKVLDALFTQQSAVKFESTHFVWIREASTS
jgi:hypothetical protein